MNLHDQTTRRSVLQGAIGAGVAISLGGVLSACSSENDGEENGGAAPRDSGAKGSPSISDFDRLDNSAMPTSESIQSWIAELAAFGARWPGSDAIHKAEGFVKSHFEAAGLTDVRFEEVTTWTWDAEEHSFSVGGVEVDAFPAYHSGAIMGRSGEFGTDAEGVAARLVDIGDASDWSPEEVRGQIVLFDLKFLISGGVVAQAADFLWDPELSLAESEAARSQANPYLTNMTDVIEALVEAGAVGFCGVLADYFESNRYINEYHPGSEMPIPGMWISPGEGERLRSQLAGDPNAVDAVLVLRGRQTETKARVVIGELKGDSSETIQVQSHHDSAWQGAVEDASGTAEVIALAHYFGAQKPETRRRTLLFTTFSSHWTGYQVHDTFAEKYTAPDSPYDIVANVTVEHIGRHGVIDPDTRELTIDDQPEPRAFIHNVSLDLQERIVELVKENDLRRTVLISDQVIGMPTDASSIHYEGVPTISFICGPAYLYDEVDTPDKVRVEDLAPVALTFAGLIDTIDETDRDQIKRPEKDDQPTGRDFDDQHGGQLGESLDAIAAAG